MGSETVRIFTNFAKTHGRAALEGAVIAGLSTATMGTTVTKTLISAAVGGGVKAMYDSLWKESKNEYKTNLDKACETTKAIHGINDSQLKEIIKSEVSVQVRAYHKEQERLAEERRKESERKAQQERERDHRERDDSSRDRGYLWDSTRSFDTRNADQMCALTSVSFEDDVNEESESY